MTKKQKTNEEMRLTTMDPHGDELHEKLNIDPKGDELSEQFEELHSLGPQGDELDEQENSKNSEISSVPTPKP